MTKTMKIVLGAVAALTLLAAITIGGVVWWILANKDTWQKEGAAAIAEGAAFGKTSTCDQCVAQAIQRLPTGTGAQFSIADQTKAQFFLTGCLKQASGSLSYCQDAPPVTDIVKSVEWRQKTALALSLTAATGVPILSAIQQHCAQVPAPAPAAAQP